MNVDRIEKRIHLKAPKSRVWRAIATPREFGAWFEMVVDGAFTPGARVTFRITKPGKYEGTSFEVEIARVEPEELFSYRWHPHAVDANVDYSGEPTTLVEFRLAEVDGGTELVVVESGFDRIPEARRAEALRMNDGGWTQQMKNVARYVDAAG